YQSHRAGMYHGLSRAERVNIDSQHRRRDRGACRQNDKPMLGGVEWPVVVIDASYQATIGSLLETQDCYWVDQEFEPDDVNRQIQERVAEEWYKCSGGDQRQMNHEQKREAHPQILEQLTPFAYCRHDRTEVVVE